MIPRVRWFGMFLIVCVSTAVLGSPASAQAPVGGKPEAGATRPTPLPPGTSVPGTSDQRLGPSDLRKLLTNPMYLYSRSRTRGAPQQGFNPAYQQQALLQQQAALAQRAAAEKAQKREAVRERRQAAAKDRRAKELQARDEQRQGADEQAKPQ